MALVAAQQQMMLSGIQVVGVGRLLQVGNRVVCDDFRWDVFCPFKNFSGVWKILTAFMYVNTLDMAGRIIGLCGVFFAGHPAPYIMLFGA